MYWCRSAIVRRTGSARKSVSAPVRATRSFSFCRTCGPDDDENDDDFRRIGCTTIALSTVVRNPRALGSPDENKLNGLRPPSPPRAASRRRRSRLHRDRRLRASPTDNARTPPPPPPSRVPTSLRSLWSVPRYGAHRRRSRCCVSGSHQRPDRSTALAPCTLFTSAFRPSVRSVGVGVFVRVFEPRPSRTRASRRRTDPTRPARSRNARTAVASQPPCVDIGTGTAATHRQRTDERLLHHVHLVSTYDASQRPYAVRDPQISFAPLPLLRHVNLRLVCRPRYVFFS